MTNKEYHLIEYNRHTGVTIVEEVTLSNQGANLLEFRTKRKKGMNFCYRINRNDINKMTNAFIICDDMKIGTVEYNQFLSKQIEKLREQINNYKISMI